MKYIRFVVAIFLFVGIVHSVSAQKEITSKDTIAIKKEKVVHSPRKATLYSAVFPGLGQIYNKKYWKLPIIYGGFIGFGYAIHWNNDHYVTYKQAYADITDDDPTTTSYLDLPHRAYNLNRPSDVRQFAENIEQAKSSARRYRDLNIIFTAAFYALNIIDASVDANFFDFDISDDLSMVWQPQPLYCLNRRMIGVNCRINF